MHALPALSARTRSISASAGRSSSCSASATSVIWILRLPSRFRLDASIALVASMMMLLLRVPPLAEFADGARRRIRVFFVRIRPRREERIAAENFANRVFRFALVCGRRENDDHARKMICLRGDRQLRRLEIVRTDKLYVPAFVEKCPFDQFGDMRVAVHPYRSRRMTKSGVTLFFSAAAATLCAGGWTQRRSPVDAVLDNTRGYRGIGYRIDQNETARRAILLVRVKKERQRRLDFHFRDVVHFQLLGGPFFERVHVDAEMNPSDARANGARGVLQQIILVHVQLIGVHPDELPAEFIAHRGKIFLGNEHVSATDINFVFEREIHGTAGAGLLLFAVKADDRFHLRLQPGRHGNNGRARPQDARCKAARESAEGRIGTYDVLHGKAQRTKRSRIVYRNSLQVFEQRRTFEPRHTRTAMNDVIAFESTHGDRIDVAHIQVRGKIVEIRGEPFEYLARIIDQVHFVYGSDDVLHAEQARDIRMAARLAQHAFRRVDEHNGSIGG